MSGIVSDIMRSTSFTVEHLMRKPRCVRTCAALYACSILGFGKARELPGLTKLQFEECLARRKAFRPYLDLANFMIKAVAEQDERELLALAISLEEEDPASRRGGSLPGKGGELWASLWKEA